MLDSYPCKNKFRNRKVERDGLKFDSVKEANRYAQLLILQKAGKIDRLETQVRYPLHVNGSKVCSYVADFVYYDRETSQQVVEDVKSPITRKDSTYRLKFKLFKAIKGFEITEV